MTPPRVARLVTRSSSTSPNPFVVAWSVIRALGTVPAPRFDAGSVEKVDHGQLAAVLDALRDVGIARLAEQRGALERYRRQLEHIDPDTLGPSEALAYWLNLYNAGALVLSADAQRDEVGTVLRVPGAFSRPWATVQGRPLSLDAIEHAKIRRFQDARIHGALVCGAASCPTLRFEPYSGALLHDQLHDQLKAFFAGGGAVVRSDDGVPTLFLSRILRWFGGDFVRPHRMPTFIPATKQAVAGAVREWLPAEMRLGSTEGPRAVAFHPYDWSLACSIG